MAVTREQAAKMAEESRERRKAKKFLNELPTRLESLQSESQSIYDTYKSRFFDENNEFKNTYRSDTEDALNKYTAFKSKFDTESQEILSHLDKYGSHLDEKYVADVKEWLTNSGESISNMQNAYQLDYDILSPYKNADEYKQAAKEQEQYEKTRAEMLDFDLEKGKEELGAWEKIQESVKTAERRLKFKWNNKAPDRDSVSDEEWMQYLEDKSWVDQYGSLKDVSNTIAEKKLYLSEAEKHQKAVEDAKNVAELMKTPEFAVDAKKGYEQFTADEAKRREQEEQSWWEEAVARSSSTSSESIIGTAINNVSYDLRQDRSYLLPNDNWKQEDKDLFGYYYLNDRAKAWSFAEATNNEINRQLKAKQVKEIEDTALSGVGANLGHQGLAILGNATGIADYLYDILEYSARGTITEKSGVTPFEYAQTVRGATADYLNDAGGTIDEDVFLLGGKGWGDVYQLGTSIVDSALTAKATGPVGTAFIYFGSAGASAVDDALERGASPEQALIYGTLMGAAESFAEYIGADKLLNIGASKTFKQFVINVLKQGGAEGIEEGVTSILGQFADNIVMGDMSEYRTKIRNYVLYQGMSQEEAVKKAWGELAESVAYDTLGGFVSGAVHAAPATAAQTVKQRAATGKEIKSSGQTSKLVEAGKALGEGTKSAKLAGKITDKTGAYTLGKLYDSVGLETSSQNRADVIKSLERKGMDSRTAERVADSMLENGVKKSDSWMLRNTYNDVIANENSTVGKRTADYDAIAQGVWEDRVRAEMGKRRNDIESSVLPAKEASQAKTEETSGKVSPSSETLLEDKFESNTEGKDLNISNDKIIERKKLVSSEKGKMKYEVTYEDGSKESIDAEKISWAREDEGFVASIVSDMNVPAGIAESLIDNYDGDTMTAATDYAAGIREAFSFGRFNMKADLNSGSFSSKLNEVQRNNAFELGRIYEKSIAETKATFSNLKTSAKGKKSGRVHYEGDELSLNEIQRESIKGLNILSEALGNDIHIYESYSKNGKRVYKDKNGVEKSAPNGMYYQSDGSIWIDLNAGNFGQGIILHTAAHELTHFIKQWSPQKFKALADFLVEQYGEKGIPVDALVKRQQQKAKNNGREIGYDEAFEEFVADSMSSMLNDGTVISELCKKDMTLAQKIKSWIDGVLKKLSSLYKDYELETEEGKLVSQMTDSYKKIQSLFADALSDASENFANTDIQAQKNTTQEGDVKLQARKQDADGNSYWQIEEDKDIFRGIKSIQGLKKAAYNYILRGDKGNKVVGLIDGKNLEFIRVSAKEYVYGIASQSLSEDAYKQKMRMSTSIIDLIDNASITYDAPDHKNHKLFPNGFKNYQGRVGIDETIFRYIVRVGKAKNGMIFYDINLEVDGKVPRANRTSLIKASTSNNKVPQKESVVNTYSMQESKNNSEKHSDRDYAISIDNVGKQRDNISRALKQGDLINEFYSALSQKQWRLFYEIIDNYSYKKRRKLGNKISVVVDNRLVVAEKQQISKNKQDFVVVDIFELLGAEDNYYLYELQEVLENERYSDVAEGIREARRLLYQRDGSSGVLRRYDTNSSAFISDDSRRGQSGSSYAQYRGVGEGTDRGRILVDNQQNSHRDDQIKRSDRDSSAISNRSLLADALESAAQSDIEKSKLREYKSKIEEMDKQSQKLSDLRREIKELSFAKGPRDKAKLRALQDEAIKTANRIDLFDKQLLRLEAAKPLQSVLEREKQKAVKRQKAKDAEILKEYKEKSIAKIEETKKHYQESRKKNVEGRQKTELRNKIKKTVKKLNHLLVHGSKEHNIKIELQDTARKAILAAEQLFDKDGGEGIGDCLSKLRFAYDMLAMSKNQLAKDAYNAETSQKLLELQDEIGELSLSELSKATLEKTYDCFKLIYTTITNVNKVFKDGKAMEVSSMSWNTINEMEETGLEVKHNHSKIVGEAIDKIDSFSWAELKPVYAFERLGSKTLMSLYWDAVRADGICARNVDDAAVFMNEQKKKFGYVNWNLDKTKTFILEDGKEFKLTLSDIMSIYAYSKREQAIDHILKGGFMFTKGKTFIETKDGEKKAFSLEKLQNTYETYRLNVDIISQIVGTLTEEQRNYVEAMQDYLSSVMGEKGNEVSRIMYGIDLFKEKHYFPLKSSTDFLNSVQEALQKTPTQTTLKNIGMAKETVPHASNPIMLESFEEVWKNHVIKMSQYNAYVVPIDNLQKVFNFERNLDNDKISVKNTINRFFGGNASKYLDNWIIDLNGGMNILGYNSPLMKRFATFKKVKTAASLSTTIQQYSAIVRATALVDSKYFITPKRLGKTVKLSELYSEMRQYAPVTIVKEIGGFDVGSTGSAMEYMSFGEYDAFGNKFKGFFTDRDYAKKAADDIFMAGAATMDKLGWMTIWSAVKNEVATETNLVVGSKEFFDACSKRFTEVIAYTQVYDSVVSRSGIMRSKSELNKFATAFMGEPTTSINMIFNAALQIRRAKKGSRFKAVKNFARTSGAVYGSIVLAALSASLIYALRDDEDEDESLIEKWTWEFGGKLRDEINPLNMLPYARDIVSIIQGFTIERPDMSLIADVIDTFKDTYKAVTSEPDKIPSAIMDLTQQMAALYGIPLGNIVRDFKAIVNGVKMVTDDIAPSQVGYAFTSGWKGEENSLKNKAIAAFKSGDYIKCKENIDAMVAFMVDEDTTEKQARATVRSTFTTTYKKLYLSAMEKGNYEKMNEIRKLLHTTGLYGSLSQLDATLKKWRLEQEE